MSSNNFFLNNDPLLYNSLSNGLDYNRQMIDYDSIRQLQTYDYLSELDELLRNSSDIMETLRTDKEYVSLSNDLQSYIQQELIAQIRCKINTNPTAVNNMKRQIEIVKGVSKLKESEQRKNLEEINDYIKNYSSITFDEYKRAKQENNHTKKEKK